MQEKCWKEDGHSIQCNVCKRWCHVACSDIDQSVLKYFKMQEETSGEHSWSCIGCLSAYAKINARVAAMENRLKDVENQARDNQIANANTAERVTVVEESLKRAETNRKKDKQDLMKETQAAWSEELRERAARQDNIIIYGLEEAGLDIENGMQRQELDNSAINELFKAIDADIKSEDIKFAIRVGKRTPAVRERPRPVKISFRCKEKRELVFDKARNIPSSVFHEISIVPDLTDQQREEDKALMTEAEKRNDELSEEDRLNFEYRCQGRRGERTIVKAKVSRFRGRGGQRGRGAPRGRGALRGRGPSANTVRLGRRASQTRPVQDTAAQGRLMAMSQEEGMTVEEELVESEEEGDNRNKRGRSPTEESPTQTSTAKASRSR